MTTTSNVSAVELTQTYLAYRAELDAEQLEALDAALEEAPDAWRGEVALAWMNGEAR